MKKPSFKKIGGLFSKIFKSKKGRIIFIVSVILIAALVFFGIKYFKAKNANANKKSITAEVTRGNVVNVIEGTGTVEAISQYEITSLAKGNVIADYFEEGDYVNKDQLLYQIDAESVNKNIKKQESSIRKAQMSYNDASENASNLTVKSTIGGVITNMYVSVGDNVQSGAKIADVIDKDTLKLSIPFGEDDAKNIYSGQSASVTLANSLTVLNGTVTSVATGTYTNSYGVNVSEVEINVKNPGTVTAGELATAKIGNFACYDSGKLEYGSTKTVTAKTSGEVSRILKKKGDAVSNGTAIVQLTNNSVSKNITDAQLSLNDANLSLDDLYDSLDDYNIKAPISGEVIQKNVKAGEKLDTNSSSVMAIIADLSSLTFDISIDELDISSISVGQEVSIQADAIENRTFKGTVSKISIVGESYQGVTSYPVTVTIDNSQQTGLIPGMNVTAQIIVKSVENVLRVPVSAVRMGNLVIVKDDGTFTDVKDSMKKMMQSNPFANQNKEQSEKKESTSSAEDISNDKNNIPQNSEGGRQFPKNANGFSQNQGQNQQQPVGENAGSVTAPSGEAGGQHFSSGSESGEHHFPSNGAGGGNFNGQQGERKWPQGNNSYHSQSGNSQAANMSSQSGDTKTADKENKTDAKAPESNNGNKKSKESDSNKSFDSKEATDKMMSRIDNMVKSLDVPEGYKVIRVQTGLTDGTYIEIIEMEGSLKEGDTVLLPDVTTSTNMNNYQGGMGGMPGGFGGMGGMPGGFGGMGGMNNRNSQGGNRSFQGGTNRSTQTSNRTSQTSNRTNQMSNRMGAR